MHTLTPTALLAALISGVCVTSLGSPAPGLPPAGARFALHVQAMSSSAVHATHVDAALRRQTLRRLDLSGRWETGSGGEPAVATITVTASCNYTPAAWVIYQNGDSLTTVVFPGRQSQGVAPRRDQPGPRTGTGTIRGLRVTIVEGSARYRLVYDRRSGHLRGTRDGKSFWAIRQRLQRLTGCIPIP